MMVADPLNATVLVAFLAAAFWHAKLGLQVVIEDYVHTPLLAGIAHLANIFVCALAAIAGVLAVVRVALGA
jgi:succinate dehydrogenase / fumarate reductase membrane anchor subunit